MRKSKILPFSLVAVAAVAAGWFAWPWLNSKAAGSVAGGSAEGSGGGVSADAAAVAKLDTAQLVAQWDREVLPIFQNYCHDCHADGVKKGELGLDAFEDIESMIANRDVWKRIRDHIDFRLMPPPDEVAPGDEEREKLIAWIDAAVFPVDAANPDPGHVTLRRLNRTEYRNTIEDLLGVKVKVDGLLPPDDTGYGFDNIGDVLTLSPVHVERYLEAARIALDKAVYPGPMARPKQVISGGDLQGPGHRSDDGHFLFTSGEAFGEVRLPRAGSYRIHVTAGGTYGGDGAPEMVLMVDGRPEQTWEVKSSIDSPAVYKTDLRIEKEGRLRLGAAFTNDYYDENFPDAARRDRNLMVNRIEIEGPLDGPAPQKPETHRRLFGERAAGQSDEAYFFEVLSRFGRRAFRRPVEADEVERYGAFLKMAKSQGDGVEHGVRFAMEAMLVSPAFLFREEPSVEGADGKKLISEHALASRLSYFLWSTMPDVRLLDLADKGELRSNLDREIERMIASEKAGALVENFAGQWLQLRDLDTITPDPERFRSFDRSLARAMRKETEMLFHHVLAEELPAGVLLNADFTFVNERLARHYGLKDVKGDDFRKVSLKDTPRRGLLGHGSVLTLTSYPTRTSPVLRGKYILENLLDTPPPPPPPNVPQLESPESRGKNLSLRVQMEKHRDDPNCSSCHALMDPIGFGLESFDAIGGWRRFDNGLEIDTSGELANGRSFENGEELRDLIGKEHLPEFHRALATKLMTYALGRGLDWYDRPAVDAVVRDAGKEGHRLSSLIRAVIHSVPFQYRRG
jgi:hypothetical protein